MENQKVYIPPEIIEIVLMFCHEKTKRICSRVSNTFRLVYHESSLIYPKRTIKDLGVLVLINPKVVPIYQKCRKIPANEQTLKLFNALNLSEIENFKLNSWVNTACPGLAFDNGNIVNSDDIKQFL